MKYAIAAGLVVSILIVTFFMERPISDNTRVYDACMRAKLEYTIFNDNYCKALQDDYGLKFVCENECKVTRRTK